MKVKLLGLAVVVVVPPSGRRAAFGKDAPIVAKTIAVGKIQATTIHAQTGMTILDSYRVAPGGASAGTSTARRSRSSSPRGR